MNTLPKFCPFLLGHPVYPGFSLYIYAVLFPRKPSMPASAHSMVVNAFQGTENLKPLCPGE